MTEGDYGQSGKTARALRSCVMLAASVHSCGAKAPTMHRIRDLSRGGVRVDNADPLQVGAVVLVSVGSLNAISAKVKWINRGFAGLAFDEEIDPEEARARAMVVPQKASRLALRR